MKNQLLVILVLLSFMSCKNENEILKEDLLNLNNRETPLTNKMIAGTYRGTKYDYAAIELKLDANGAYSYKYFFNSELHEKGQGKYIVGYETEDLKNLYGEKIGQNKIHSLKLTGNNDELTYVIELEDNELHPKIALHPLVNNLWPSTTLGLGNDIVVLERDISNLGED